MTAQPRRPRSNPRTKSAPPPAATPGAEPRGDTPATAFPIVGIGASAGGLEALEQFLGSVPPTSGLAFVVVQHLDPTYKGMIVELLQRAATIPVTQAEDGMKVEPDHVYVIPPNRDLSILHGVLYLLEPAAPRGLRLPIDFFFRALADDQQALGIGVILSGMGSDGMLGLRAIKEKAGAVFVQTPASAKFDGMPRSAVDDGQADVVASAAELPGRIIGYLQHLPTLTELLPRQSTDTNQSGLEKVLVLLRARTGHDFSLYKKSTLYRRIERRMGLHQIPHIGDYVRYLRENPQEAELLFKELLIGVTRFFRDPEVWKQLRTEVLPALLATHPEGSVLRAWTAGCSTGEEAYSLAIVFREVLRDLTPAARHGLQIFATDLDHDAIDKARTGNYPANIAADVGEERLKRYFVQDEHGYRVSNEIREMVIFAPQNLVMDPPFTRLDLLSCRNLLIYLEAELQKKLLPLFHYSLKPGGVLMLGSAETIGDATDLFAPLPGRTRLYRRQDHDARTELAGFPSAFGQTRGSTAVATGASTAAEPSSLSAPNLQALTEAQLLLHHCPPAVLTNDKGDIAYISGKTGKYLEPAAGQANLNIFAMLREGLSGAVHAAFGKALRQKATVCLKSLRVGTNGGTQYVDVTLQPMITPGTARDMVLVVFSDVIPPDMTPVAAVTDHLGAHRARLSAAEEALKQCRDELHITREEMQSSQEELKAANEELQSTNEELQSTNEELTTSKEEMQSMNEELQTVNHELQAKVDELSQASDDMKNLLNSTDIATLFLDDDLRVRRFTNQTTTIIKLIPGDAGRPVTDLVTELDYPQLADDVREVLRSLIFHECRVPARDGRWFVVRIMPYRTQDNRIDGVVITFVDITVAKTQEDTLREALAALQGRFAEQSEELDRSRTLEAVLTKAQDILELRLARSTK
ncbi:MAG TPA: chemotaxis protein CheB [Thauera phenylacetica]|jgi:two-component system CheB/CheR fusion protein|uniref:protein-glutamate O-methyltransferase n=1 Tax=Thauera phenylacetica B4P TaxID=1234382 RepID=N6YUY6_9RHOO|nr:chemotaxis protein CheB [Thauera phenylacetica]ENO98091.1 MCP methyltransferase/methylesterase [Thauera phenylacetica B4P]HRM67992.1 chemotaxis protein CheB [Thauera phenylacetica]